MNGRFGGPVVSTRQTHNTSATDLIDASDIRSELQKVLAGATFINSERLSRFLAFTTQMTLEGRGRELKEYLIGLEVFDRPPSSYDPRVDPIVRVQAGRLRSKL